jgi:hypothetical protein
MKTMLALAVAVPLSMAAFIVAAALVGGFIGFLLYVFVFATLSVKVAQRVTGTDLNAALGFGTP